MRVTKNLTKNVTKNLKQIFTVYNNVDLVCIKALIRSIYSNQYVQNHCEKVFHNSKISEIKLMVKKLDLVALYWLDMDYLYWII